MSSVCRLLSRAFCRVRVLAPACGNEVRVSSVASPTHWPHNFIAVHAFCLLPRTLGTQREKHLCVRLAANLRACRLCDRAARCRIPSARQPEPASPRGREPAFWKQKQSIRRQRYVLLLPNWCELTPVIRCVVCPFRGAPKVVTPLRTPLLWTSSLSGCAALDCASVAFCIFRGQTYADTHVLGP